MPYKEGKAYRAQIYRGGRRYSKRCRTKKEALAWETAKSKELERLETHMASLLEVATKYLDYAKAQYTKSTYSDKRLALKEMMAALGNISIEQVDPGTILHEILLKQPTPQLYNKRRKDLSAFFEYSIDFHRAPFNPVKATKKRPVERVNQPMPTYGEYAKFLLKLGPGQDRNLVITLAESGARRSEIFRLTWSDDVDFHNRLLRLGNRKNRRREMKYRRVPMSDELYETLQDQFKRRLSHSDYVFQNRAVWENKQGLVVRKHPNYGDRFTARRKFMRGLCKRAGVKPMGFHGLRRFYASKLVEQGLDLETIRGRMGHHAVSVTDRYIQRIRDDERTGLAVGEK